MRKRIIFFLICFLVLAYQGYAATPETGQQVATNITSDTMIYDSVSNQVVFQGHVHVVRENFQLWSEKLIIYFSKKAIKSRPQAKGAKQNSAQDLSDVEKIVALRHVRILSRGKKGFCEKATFWQQDGLMQMEGDPRLEDGGNQIRGEIIKLYTKDNRSEVLGGKKKVQAIFYSRPDKVK